MSGVAVIRALIVANSSVTAVVPATRIRTGDLPNNTVIPAISIKQISSMPYNLIKTNETNKMHRDRVQVTVYRNADGTDDGYPGLKTLLDLILTACASQRATVASIAVDSVQPGHEGPDLYVQDTDIVTRSRDFVVTYLK